MTFKVFETQQLDSAVCLRTSSLWAGAGGEEGQGVERSLNNHAALLVLPCRDHGGSLRVCSSPIIFMATEFLAIWGFSFPRGTESKAGWALVVP